MSVDVTDILDWKRVGRRIHPKMIPFPVIMLALVQGAKALDEYLKHAERKRQEAARRELMQARREAERRKHAAEEAAARRAAEEAAARRVAEEAAARHASRVAAAAEAARVEEQTRKRRLADPLADYLSYSRLRSFHECPRKFYFKYILERTGDESRLPVASGKAFHEWLEGLLEPHVGREFPHARLHAAPDWYRGRAANLARRIPSGSMLVGVEHEVSYTIGGLNVLGYVDILYREPSGTLVIADVKTGSAPKIHLEQLEMYSLLLLNSERGLRLEYHLVDLDELVWWRVAQRHGGRLWDDLKANADVIRKEREFSPIPGGHCRTCPFFDECPDAGASRGKPSSLRLVQLRTAKRGSKEREQEFGYGD